MIKTPQVLRMQQRQMDLLIEASQMGEIAFITGQGRRNNPFILPGSHWLYQSLASAWDEGWFLGASAEATRSLSGWDSMKEIYTQYGLPFRPGHIYVLSSPETHFCKIGRTNNLKRRLTELATLPPFEYDVEHVFTADDSHQAEAALHSRFAQSRKRGEWFSLSLADIAWLQSIVAHKYSKFYFRDDQLPVPQSHYASDNS